MKMLYKLLTVVCRLLGIINIKLNRSFIIGPFVLVDTGECPTLSVSARLFFFHIASFTQSECTKQWLCPGHFSPVTSCPCLLYSAL